MRKTAFLLCLILMALPATAFADTVTTFSFNQNLGSIGLTDTFKIGDVTIILDGFLQPLTPGIMWMKNRGDDEIGVGLASNGDHEIAGNLFVQVDLTKVVAQKADSIILGIGSLQRGENYNVYGSNTPGVRGALLASDISLTSFNAPTNFDFISIGGGSEGDVTLETLTVSTPPVSPTPELPTAVFVLVGMAFAALLTAKRKAVV